MKNEDAPRTVWSLIWVAAFVALAHVAWGIAEGTIIAERAFADGDSYTRQLRALRLWETGGWFDSSLPRANAPFGASVHWTRPFDVLLIGLALPLIPVLGVTGAVYWAGVLISPLLHLGTALTLVWAGRPLIGRTGACIAGALTAAQFGILGLATVGHSDHHMLFALLTVWALGLFIRCLAERSRGLSLAAGAALALGLWVGPEVLVFTGICLFVAGLVWLSGEEGGADLNVWIAAGLAAGLALVLLAERGIAGYFDVEYDRVSIVHVTGAALVLTFWAAVRAPSRSWGGPARFAAAASAAAVAGAVVGLLLPGVFVNPLAGVDPALLAILDQVAEYAPIGDVPHFLIYVGGALFAVPWTLRRLQGDWRGTARWAWLLVAAALIVYLSLALNWVRWSLYAGLFLSVALADLMVRVDQGVTRRFGPPWRLPVLALAIVVLAVGPLAVGAAAILGEGSKAAERPCPVNNMARYLNGPEWSGGARTIVASANFGPELLYRTPHRVVATVNHRNGAGMLDGYRILGGGGEAAVVALIRDRDIGLILLCPGSDDDAYFLKGGDGNSLYRRLETGDLPAWLGEVALPANLGRHFRLFRVAGR